MSQYKRRMSNVCLFCIIGSSIQLLLHRLFNVFNVFNSLALINRNYYYLSSSIVNWAVHLIFRILIKCRLPIPLKNLKPNVTITVGCWFENIWQRSTQQIFEERRKKTFHFSIYVHELKQSNNLSVYLYRVIYNLQLQYHMRRLNTCRIDECCCRCCCFTMYWNAMYQFVIEITIKYHHVSCWFHISIVIAIDVWIDQITEVLPNAMTLSICILWYIFQTLAVYFNFISY